MAVTVGEWVTDRTPADVVELLRFWMEQGHVTKAEVAEASALARDAFENGPNRTRDEMGRAVVVLARVLRQP